MQNSLDIAVGRCCSSAMALLNAGWLRRLAFQHFFFAGGLLRLIPGSISFSVPTALTWTIKGSISSHLNRIDLSGSRPKSSCPALEAPSSHHLAVVATRSTAGFRPAQIACCHRASQCTESVCHEPYALRAGLLWKAKKRRLERSTSLLRS